MEKTLLSLALGILLLVLSGCGDINTTSTAESHTIFQDRNWNVQKVTDSETGATCYVATSSFGISIDCLGTGKQ